MPKSLEEQHIKEIYDNFARIPENDKDKKALEEARRLSNGAQESLQEGFKSGAVIIHELFQNANDSVDISNTAISGKQDQKKIEITISIVGNNYLIFSHTGGHFSIGDVIKICRIRDHETSGKQNDARKTGYKGLGFKSLFTISTDVTVLSDKYRFCFNKQKVETEEKSTRFLPWQLMPIWVPEENIPAILRSQLIPQRVTFIIKLTDEGAPKINDELLNLQRNPTNLLFLSNIKKVSFPRFEISLQNGLATVQPTTSFSEVVELEIERITNVSTIKSKTEIKRWLTHDFSINISPELIKKIENLDECPPRLKTAKTTLITFAIEVDSNGRIIKTSGGVYATLPLPKINVSFPVHINADFLPDTYRIHLIENVWNYNLWYHIAYQHFNFLAMLAASSQQSSLFLRALAPRQIGLSGASKQHYESGFEDAVQNISFIPINQAHHRLFKVSEVIVDLYGFFSRFNPPYSGAKKLIDPCIESVARLPNELNVSKLTSFELLYYVQIYLQQTPDPQKHRELLLFLKSICDNQLLAINDVKQTALILCTNSTLVKPGPTIFMGDGIPQVIINTLQLQFMNPNIIGQDHILFNWLKDSLGLKESTVKELIEVCFNHIKKINTKSLTEIDLNFILKLTYYLLSLYSNGFFNNNSALWQQIINSLPVVTIKNSLLPSTLCYLANSYQPDLLLENQLPYLQILVSNRYLFEENDPFKWKSFFLALKVASSIKLEVIPRYNRIQAEYQNPYMTDYFNKYCITKSTQKESHYLTSYLDVTLFYLLLDPVAVKIYEYHFWNSILEDFSTIMKYFNLQVEYIMGGGHKMYTPTFLKYFLETYEVVLAQDGKRYKCSKDLYSPHLAQAIGTFRNVAKLPENVRPLTAKEGELLGFTAELTIDDCLEFLTKLSYVSSPNFDQYVAIFRIILDSQSVEEIQVKCGAWSKRIGNKLPAQSNQMQDVSMLRIVDTTDADFENPPDSADLIKQFDGISNEEMLRLAKYFNILSLQTIISAKTKEIDYTMKERLWKKLLPVIAIIIENKKKNDSKEYLIKLRAQFQRLEIIKCTNLCQNIAGETLVIDEGVYLQINPKPILYYQTITTRATRQTHEPTLPIDNISRAILKLFDISIIKVIIMNELLLLLIIDDVNEPILETWLKQKRYQTDKYRALVAWHLSIDAPSIHITPNDLPHTAHPSSQSVNPIHEEISQLSVDSANKTVLGITATSLDVKNPQPHSIPQVESKPVATNNSTGESSKVIAKFQITKARKQGVFFKKTNATNSNTLSNIKTDNHDDDSLNSPDDQIQPAQNNKTKKPQKEMDEAEKTAIGAWGEIAVFRALIDKYQAKIDNNQGRFAGCILEETTNGFKITKNQQTILECVWNNKHGMGESVDYNERKLHFDFKIVKSQGKNGFPLIENRIIIIEVKSTKETRAAIAHLSKDEINEMRAANERYRLYRLYGAGNQNLYFIKKFKRHELPIAEDQPNATLFKVELKI